MYYEINYLRKIKINEILKINHYFFPLLLFFLYNN